MPADDGRHQLSRRRLLSGALALGASAAWAPAFRLTPAIAAATPPPGFPPSIELYRQAFENWSGQIRVEDLWTCAPSSPADVVAVANWAHRHGYQVRPRGYMHTWSPLTVAAEGDHDRVVLVDTTQHLTEIEVIHGSPATVRTQTGVAMEHLLQVLEDAGYGLTTVPVTGMVSVGGVLAIDGHGASLPARAEEPLPGHVFGTLSNAVLSLTAVVWSKQQRRYVLQTFDRTDPRCKAFLVHLGRAFLTEVTLQVGPDVNLRCVSRTDIPGGEMFAPPGEDSPGGDGRTFASFVEDAGRAEAIWFPFTENPWLKVWSVAPERPLASREVTEPYNYPYSDNLPDELADLAREMVTGRGELTPLFGQAAFGVIAAGLAATASHDIWGRSKNLLLCVRPSTLRAHEASYTVLTRRADIQRVVAEFVAKYLDLLEVYRRQGRYPINLGLELRATGLDVPGDVLRAGAEAPVLSAVSPRLDRPDWDVAVWMCALSMPGTQYAYEFWRELETWVLSNYTGSYAAVRPEWSKGWAYTDAGAWTATELIDRTWPRAFSIGRGRRADWSWAIDTLNRHDPHRIFSNPFLDRLLR